MAHLAVLIETTCKITCFFVPVATDPVNHADLISSVLFVSANRNNVENPKLISNMSNLNYAHTWQYPFFERIGVSNNLVDLTEFTTWKNFILIYEIDTHY